MDIKRLKKVVVFAIIFFTSLIVFILGLNNLIGMVSGYRDFELLDLTAMISMVSFPFYIIPLLRLFINMVNFRKEITSTGKRGA